MLQIPKLEIGIYLNIVIRRKWWVIIPFALALLGGVAYLKTTPKVYRASTLILIEPQSIPDSFVKSTVTESVESRLRTITQQVHSRTNLEDIISRFNLMREAQDEGQILVTVYNKMRSLLGLPPMVKKEQKNERVALMDLVERLRQIISINLRGGHGNQAFEISFDWFDPDVAAQVTNAIAAKFIEENLNVREQIAIATTDFLDKETSRIRKDLEDHEKEVETFKKQNMGQLPDELESNINILNQLREELNNVEKRIDTEKQTVLTIDAQMQLQKSFTDSSAAPTASDAAKEGTPVEDLATLQQTLDALKMRYTDKHPDIQALKRQVERLKKEQEAGGGAGKTTASVDPKASKSSAISPIEALTLQRGAIQNHIASYEKQSEDIKNQIQLYKERVERTPQVEIELTKIIRDYETVQKRYQALLAKKLDAQMSEELERRQKGEQFRVLDPAIKPERPFKPDAKKIVFLTLVLGLGSGCGLAYFREMLDPCFYNPEEAEEFLAAEVIVSLPLAKMEAVTLAKGSGSASGGFKSLWKRASS